MIITLFLVSVLSLALILISFVIERYIFKTAPFLKEIETNNLLDTSLTIIIPTFNEEINIEKCLNRLNEIKRPTNKFKILVVDDSSTDNTLLVARKYKNELLQYSEELEIISSGARPTDKNWVGKNWPCHIGSQKVNSEWILFIDADLIVSENCIFNALSKAITDKIDLLSLAPRVNCNCLSEWMVQPIMTNLLTIGFPIFNTNDVNNDTSFAAGPFMLFKKDSYIKIGGHEGTHNEVVEDLALAKKIKNNNLKLNFLIAIKDLSLNMYSDLDSLIEGWSKNWFLGLNRDLLKSISASIFVLLTYSYPLLVFLTTNFISISQKSTRLLPITIISLVSLITYAIKRFWLERSYSIPSKYWYLTSIGGLIVFYISLVSIYKTYTGRGWTWKGRNLFSSRKQSK